MNAMTYNNAKQYWTTFKLNKSDTEQQNDIVYRIKTKNMFD